MKLIHRAGFNSLNNCRSRMGNCLKHLLGTSVTLPSDPTSSTPSMYSQLKKDLANEREKARVLREKEEEYKKEIWGLRISFRLISNLEEEVQQMLDKERGETNQLRKKIEDWKKKEKKYKKDIKELKDSCGFLSKLSSRNRLHNNNLMKKFIAVVKENEKLVTELSIQKDHIWEIEETLSESE